MHRGLHRQPFAHDRDQHVRADGGPELGLHRVLGGAEECLDAQVLLDPLEEEFDPLAHLVEPAHRQGREVQVAGDEYQLLACLGTLEADPPQWLRVSLFGIEDSQCDRVVADHPGTAVGIAPCESLEAHPAFGTGDEEGARLIEASQTLGVDVPSIDDIEGACLGNGLVENIDVVELAIADVQESGDISSQIQQRVQLDCRFGRAKRRPGKQRQAQIDGRRVERVDGVGQLEAERFVRVELARHRDQTLRELGVDAPVSHGTRVRQCVGRHLRPQSHVVELPGLCAQARLDVAQTLSEGQLREEHDGKLLEATEALDLVLAVIAGDAATKRRQRQMRGQLCEDQFSVVQGSLGTGVKSAPACRNGRPNRDRQK